MNHSGVNPKVFSFSEECVFVLLVFLDTLYSRKFITSAYRDKNHFLLIFSFFFSNKL